MDKGSPAPLSQQRPHGEQQERDALMASFGVRYFEPGSRVVAEALEDNLYWYRAYVGTHEIQLAAGDSLYWLSGDRTSCHVARGPLELASEHFAVMLRGYMPERRSTTITQRTTLPYVNGCSTKQVFAPERPGDPTLQLLRVPPYSAEQAHHIHSTVRVVYILGGRGDSVVGMDRSTVREPLLPGKVCILEPMCPHHFETDEEPCVVLPFHVFSTTPGVERLHPMYSGTFLTNQGRD